MIFQRTFDWTDYTVLDKSNEQIIQDLRIQQKFHPFMDAAKLRIQKLVDRMGPHQDAADRFLDYLEDEYDGEE
ncbi:MULTISPECIES: hypothetical protein [Fictibacillus]|uniref:Uncharacterized protein n=1 Tax=Fictibacillus terranigra TaxID=3058424 RepID=A0ABT8ECC8_9BACL|nr:MULTISPECIES: hypothetical protein [unclassified Fictibacillus]MDN4075487.1 hypothetical protein [Fictibacillus sp. CENA-BCM004]MED2974166.1 hypothetical protein [Fictibacillus sp. B-59209]